MQTEDSRTRMVSRGWWAATVAVVVARMMSWLHGCRAFAFKKIVHARVMICARGACVYACAERYGVRVRNQRATECVDASGNRVCEHVH